jgi:hypothetical protein
MRFSWWCSLPLLAAATLLAPACTVRIQDDFTRGTEPDVPPATNSRIDFVTQGTVYLVPGEVHELKVAASPPGAYEISFALLGDVLDGSLDQARIVSNADGTATVMLKAPSAQTTFRVRASIPNGPSIEATVVVSEKAFGTVRAVPVYMGKRAVTEWHASVIPGSNCKTVTDTPSAPETTFTASAPAGKEPVVHGVPAGPPLAVVLRAGSYLWGCADAPELQAGQELDVKVTVIDKPIELLSTELDLTFALDNMESDPYGEILTGSAALVAEGFLPVEGDLAAAELLAAMEAAAPMGTAPAFQKRRVDMGWDALVTQHLADLPMSLQDKVKAWTLSALGPPGAPTLPESSFIVARLTAVAEAPGKALLVVEKIGGVDAAKAGVPDDHLVTWTADASDTVMLNGSIYWLPSRFAGASTLIGAKAELPSVSTMSEALSQVLGCGVLAAALGGFEGCDTQCTAGLCNAALAARWEDAQNASAKQAIVGEISITAGGLAKVNDVAAPISFEGKWLGTIAVDGLSKNIAGTLVGAAPAPPPP